MIFHIINNKKDKTLINLYKYVTIKLNLTQSELPDYFHYLKNYLNYLNWE